MPKQTTTAQMPPASVVSPIVTSPEVAKVTDGDTPLTAFADWSTRYLKAPSDERDRLLPEGIKLAEARRPILKAMIQESPRQALENAVPMVVRQQLPASLLPLLEKRVNGVAAMRVYQGAPMPGEPMPAKGIVKRVAEFKGGETYQAYVYGKREEKLTWTAGASLNGIAVDKVFAVNDSPSRMLEPGEIPPAGKPIVAVCPVSGLKTEASDIDPNQPFPDSLPAVETATEIVSFCGQMHIDPYNQTLLMGEGVSGGAFGFTGILPSAPTPALGIVKVLAIPMTFADQNAIPSTEAQLSATLRDVADYYAKGSFGRLTLMGSVSPPVKLPHNEAWYVNRDTSNGGDIDGEGTEHLHAREEARKLGYDWNDYDCIVVRHNGGPGSYGGLGGGSSVWARSDGVSLWAHEIGHCFALAHANFWDTAGTSSIGAGTNQEYGHSYDVMGGAGTSGHYNVQAKYQIKWLPQSFVQNVTASGLYRVYAQDQSVLVPGRAYAMTITKDTQKTYWGEVRANFDTTPWIKQGLMLGWRYPSGSGSNLQLIDTTPGSPFAKEDSPIALGSTFSDFESGIHMTTVGFNDSPRSIDVLVNFGTFPTNNKPTLTLAASSNSVPVGATVTFTATATDPDGDTLAYSWQNFGDTSVKIVSPNSNTITRTFSTAGSYIVTCTASDMKGGSTTRNVLVTVGSGNSRYIISGRVTLLGQGLQDVVVTANGANGVVTDADGYYTIPNLAANTYTMTPLLYGYTFAELFNNSVTVGPNGTGADFEATATPVVTIAATVPQASEVAPVTTGKFTLTRTGDLSQALVVNVNTASGGATKTTDYTFAPDYVAGSQGFSTFTIPVDTTTLDIVVTPVVDAVANEGPETVILQLGPGNGYLVGTQATATIVINDNATLPKVSIVATTDMTIENGPTPGAISFTRTGSTAADLVVPYTISGSAVNGTDYVTLSGTLSIPAGFSSAVLNVTTINDSQSEPLETVKLTIATGAAIIADPLALTATVNLVDDDVQTVTVAASDPTAQEVDLTQPGAIANTGTFLITRSGDTTNPLNIFYAVTGNVGSGTMALHGVDYEALPGVLTIPAGASQATVTIQPRFDNIGEGTEQVLLALGAGSTNYVLGTPSTAVVTINDAVTDVPYIDVVNTSNASEPSTNGNFRFTVRGSVTAPLTVNYTVSGTAQNGVDYDAGQIWTTQTSGTTNALRGVWGSSTSNVVAVGDAGTIVRWNGSAWSADTSGTTSNLRAIWGSAATSIWAVGDAGTILKYNGTTWSAQTSGTTNHLRGVWGTDASNVWAVGDGGTILKFNGTAWSAQTSGITTTLNSVWGSDVNNVWAVGTGGVVRKFTSGTWAAQTSGVTTDLNSVWGSSATVVWAVGANGVVRKFNGTSWSALTTGATATLNSIWGADANNIWMTGANGVALRSTNGSSFSSFLPIVAANLNSVRGIDANTVWAVGDAGTVMNWVASAHPPLSGSFIVMPGTSTYDLPVRTLDDALAEDLESITLTIQPSANYSTFAASGVTTMWLRDDEQPTVYVDTQVGTGGSSTFTEGASTTPVKFYVSRTGATTNALVVNFSLGGNAIAGTDYTVTTGAALTFDNVTGTGVLTIPAASSGADIPIAVTNDTAFEGTEKITFDFTSGSYARGPGTSMLIADNDTATVNVGFQAPSSSGLESNTTVNIPVSLSAASASPVSVDYALGTTTTGSSSSVSTQVLPYWVRVVRNGSTMTYFESMNGTTWVQRGGPTTVSGLSTTTYYAGLCVASGSTTTNTATIDNFMVTGLTGGSTGTEASVNLGNAGPSGTHTVASGVYSFNTPGNGVLSGSTADQFRFVYVPVNNSTTCTVTARVVAQGSTAANARAGVMLRNDITNQGAIYAATMINGTLGFIPASRATLSAASATQTAVTTPILSQWFKLERVGDAFRTYRSNDGVTWASLGSTTQTIAMGPKALAGLMVSARSDGTIATATFDNVSLSTGGALLGREVGFVNADGSESFDGLSSTWTVSGSGAAISTGSDEGRFVAAEVNGDFTLIARLITLSGGASNAQAGLMVRQDRTHYSRGMYCGWSNASALEQFYRVQSVSTAFGSGIDYTLAPGTLTFAPNETTKNIVLSVTNDNMREPNNLVTIQLLNPNGAGLTSLAYHGYTIIDDDSATAQPLVGFAASSSTVMENAVTATLQVSLSAPAAGTTTIDYATADDTALAGTDYTAVAGTLSFATGETVKTIIVPVLDDATVEGAKSFKLNVTNPSGCVLGSLSTHTVTINDDDLPVVTIVANDASAAEAGLDPGQFTVTRTGPTTAALSVTLARSGTAASGTDFAAIATPLTLTIPVGAASATLNVTPLQDTTNEGNETVIETISTNAAYVIGTPSSATVTIADDDRSTVEITATDAIASETGSNTGTFTVTRTAPITGTLSVTLGISGTAATDGSDYSTPTVTSSTVTVAFAANEASKTVLVTPVNDLITEGNETVVATINSGSTYTIGTNSYATVTIQDNDNPPSLFISSPTAQGPLVANGNGIIVTADVSDDGAPAPVTLQWSQASGPGTATFESPTNATTAVTFDTAGTYVLRVTATDTQFTVSDQVTVVVGSSIVAADWITQDLGPSTSRRGQGLQYGSQFSVSGTGVGYAGQTTDQAHVMIRQVDGDGSIVARLTSLPTTGALAGLTVRDTIYRGSRRAVLGYVPGTGLQFRTRTTASTADTVVSASVSTLPLWLKLERNSTTGEVTASYAADVAGAAGTWTVVGTPTVITMDNRAAFGLTTTSNSTSSTATALFDNVTLTPAPSGPALLAEDAGAAPTTTGSGSVASGTYTIAGNTSGYYYGWQFHGDLMITAKHATATSGAGSATSGIRISENIESGGQAHVGRIPTGSYNGYYWRSLAGGGGGGVPSFTGATRWVRIIRKGNSITAFHAADSGGNPGTWAQIGQPQTVIMTTPVWVGFWVDNASGVGLNTVTFNNLSIQPLNKAPIVGVTSVTSPVIASTPISGTVTDDGYPTPGVTKQWSVVSSPGISILNAINLSTTATITGDGLHKLRLFADDSSAQSFVDLSFTGYVSNFSQWQGNTFTNSSDPNAAPDADPDKDGLCNLLEYATGTSGAVGNASPITNSVVPVSSDKYLSITVPKNPAATDVTYVVEATSDLGNPTSWSSAGLVPITNSSTTLQVRDNVPLTGSNRRFMRVRVTKP